MAFEFCRAWQDAGNNVRHLFVSAVVAPHLFKMPSFADMSDEGVIKILDILGVEGLQVMKDDSEFAAVAMRIIQSDIELFTDYECEPNFSTRLPLTVFSADSDPIAPRAGIEKWRSYALCEKDFYHHQYSSGHMILNSERASVLDIIADVINEYLAESTAVACPLLSFQAEGRVTPVFLVGGVGMVTEDFEAVLGGDSDERLSGIVLEPPGRGQRANQRPLRRLEPLAELLEEELSPITSSIVLIGHDVSAHVALDVCRKRLARGLPVDHLIVSCAMAPSCYVVPRWGHLEAFLELASEDSNGNPLRDASARAAIDADLSLAFHYEPDTELTGCIEIPVTAVAVLDDKVVSWKTVRDWSKVTRGRFNLRQLQGGHDYFQRQPELLREIVASVLADHDR